MSSPSHWQRTRHRFWSLLLGYDIFISYRRDDASGYARTLAESMENRGFACFLDQEETVGGVRLSPAIRRALRRSRTLIVVLTENVMRSEWMKQEIVAFEGRPNRVVPISVAGFLSDPAEAIAPFDRLREISWLDETSEAVINAMPSQSVIDAISKSHGTLRVRRIANAMMVVAFVGIGGVGYGLNRLLVEGRRQADIFYAQLSSALAEVRTLLRFMIFAAQDYSEKPIDPKSLARFEQFAAKDVVATIGKLNLALPKTRKGPVIGYGSVFPPGGERRAVLAISDSAGKLAAQLEALGRRNEPAVDREVVEWTNKLATNPTLRLLSDAPNRMERYHRIEDSELQPYHVLRSAGVGLLDDRDFLRFLHLAARLSQKLGMLVEEQQQ